MTPEQKAIFADLLGRTPDGSEALLDVLVEAVCALATTGSLVVPDSTTPTRVSTDVRDSIWRGVR